MDLKSKYINTLGKLENVSGYNRLRAEKRFLLIREFEDYFEKDEKIRLEEKFRRKQAMKDFCRKKGISHNTFYRWMRFEKKFGIHGLIPGYGNRAKKTGLILDCIKSTGSKSISLDLFVRFDVKKPLACLGAIKNYIENSPEISEQNKKDASIMFDFILPRIRNHYFKSLSLELSNKEIEKLKWYKAKCHKKHSKISTALLMAHRHYTAFEISTKTGCSMGSVYRWLREFNTKRVECIETKVDLARREEIKLERTTRVIDILHAPPSSHNINRTSWNYDSIIKAYKETYGEPLPKGALKRIIKKTGYTWRHARRVLTSNDPDYTKKITKVLEALRNVKETESFFFIDELGPYKVKKYGGKSLVPQNVTKTIPEHQGSKGDVQAICALDAHTNQLTWEFIEHKNVPTVIAFLKRLKRKYSEKTKLYVTWDAISCHRADRLNKWIAETKKEAEAQMGCPAFKIIPLPSKSQFLNVIESVFGGMKKAVIENSDYASKEEMLKAIDRHFSERNAFFLENPKRVGNKIWDKEAFEIERIPGGLFKKM